MGSLEEYLRDLSGRPPYKLTFQITRNYWESGGDYADVAAKPATGFNLWVVTMELNSNTVGEDGAISVGRFLNDTATSPTETVFDTLTFQEELRPFFADFSGCPIIIPDGQLWRVMIGATDPVGRGTITGWEIRI